MTLQQFITTYTGKKVGNGQCVSLMRQYLVDVLKLPEYALHALGTWGGAKDLYNKFSAEDAKSFIKVPNTPNGIPPVGAIIVFKTSILPPWLFGISGHVGMVVNADLYHVTVFHLNYPTGSTAQQHTFTYKDSLGWFIKK